MDALLRFLNRPILIKRSHPTRGMCAAFSCLLVLWPMANVADLVTTAILLARGSHEGNPLAAWALAHGGLGALAVQKVLAPAVVLAVAPPGFRVFPRLTLILLALLFLLVATAVIWNTGLLILR